MWLLERDGSPASSSTLLSSVGVEGGSVCWTYTLVKAMTQNGCRDRWKGLCQLPLGQHAFLFPSAQLLAIYAIGGRLSDPLCTLFPLVLVSIVLTGAKVVSQALDSSLGSWSPQNSNCGYRYLYSSSCARLQATCSTC